MDKKSSKGINYIIALSCMFLVMIIVGTRYSYYYDLNDDVLMKDIIAGNYSGISELRNIQMLFPMSAFLGLLYRMPVNVPWYGMLLIFFQYGSIVIISAESLSFINIENNKTAEMILKIMTSLSEIALVTTLMLQHMVNVQYTITVAFLASAAIMQIICIGDELDNKAFLIKAVPAIVLVGIGFLLRSEMMLLCLPFVGVAFIYRYSFEKELFNKKTAIKYLSVFAAIGVIILAGLLINKAAYSDAGWSKFVNLFNARTELYDFQIIPEYEGNEDFYESEGLASSEAVLFENYNFGLDDKIDDQVMWDVARYAASIRSDRISFTGKLYNKVRIYLYQISHGKNSVGSDYPYNYVTIVLYLFIIALIIGSRRVLDLWKVCILFAGRSLIWIYILMGDRSPDRITHSLYLVEIILLLGLLLRTIKTESFLGSGSAMIYLIQTGLVLAALLLFSGIVAKDNIYLLNIDQAKREDVNEEYEKLYEYMSDNEEVFYLLDVYSTVAYSEKIFGSMKDVSKKNSETMGGWFYGSPIQKSKLSNAGYKSMEEALLSDGVYFVKNKDNSLDFIIDYYGDKNIELDYTMIDQPCEGFEIYDFNRK